MDNTQHGLRELSQSLRVGGLLYRYEYPIGLIQVHLLGTPSPKWVCLTTPHPSTAPAEEIISFCERWAAEALFALTTMTACSQRVELRAA